jgi:NTE family protein
MNRFNWRCWPSLAILFCITPPVLAEDAAPADVESEAARPRVGLVLGGGGARGAAHIGVLKELERLRIPVDAIVGTSMGAIIGGLYATGMTAEELEELVGSLDWADAMSDDPDREDLSFRRKQDDREAPIDIELGLRGSELILPKGAIQGQKLDLLLRELTLDVSHIGNYDDLPIPFRAVASDIERGEAWVMGEGDLARSIRASMSVPAIIAPVRVDGRLLVDGGLVGNLPVEIMQQMDVDVIIAVDVEFPLYGPEDLDSVLKISEQMLTILMRSEKLRQIDRLGARDVLIQPELGIYPSTNFADILDTIEPGAAAARGQAEALAALSLDESAWQAHLASRGRPARPSSGLAFVRVVHDGVLASEVLESKLTIQAGDPIDHTALAHNANKLYGLQIYEQVSYSLVETDKGTGVEFQARTKSWGPNLLNFGLTLEDDFDGSTAFNISARMTRSRLNRLGAEWRNDFRLGTDPEIVSEFYQPLSFDSRFFIAPRVEAAQTNLNAFTGDQPTARYRLTEGQLGLDAGFDLDRKGELRVGLFHGLGKADVRIGDTALEDFDYRTGGAFARLRFDTLDDAFFPTDGFLGDLKWTLSRPDLGADSRFDTVEGEITRTFSRGRNTYQLGFAYATTLESDGAVQNYFPLGGFLRLSGLERGEISGPHAALARLVYYRRIGETTGLLDTPIYLGFSAETGNAWQRRSAMDFDTMLLNGSLFAGFDTFIGPVYFAAGFAEGGGSNFYLFIGEPTR